MSSKPTIKPFKAEDPWRPPKAHFRIAKQDSPYKGTKRRKPKHKAS